jgi:hypothetical protein
LLFTVATAVAVPVTVNVWLVIKVPASVPVYEDPGVTEDTHELVALEPFVHETVPVFEGTVLETVIEEGIPGTNVESVVVRVLAEGVGTETAAVFEYAAVDPTALVAVTRQRIGLA